VYVDIITVHVQDLKYFRGSDKLDLLVYNLSTSGTDQPTPFLYRIAISYTYVTAKTVSLGIFDTILLKNSAWRTKRRLLFSSDEGVPCHPGRKPMRYLSATWSALSRFMPFTVFTMLILRPGEVTKNDASRDRTHANHMTKKPQSQ
jgi:hypothetical protein